MPCLVIIDETAELLDLDGDAEDAKEARARREQTRKSLGSLARRSRFVSIVMCVATQRADATIIPVEARGNLGTRVLTGEGEPGHKQMAFGTQQTPRLRAGYPQGRGRVMVGGGLPREMQVPWISTEDILAAYLPPDERDDNGPEPSAPAPSPTSPTEAAPALDGDSEIVPPPPPAPIDADQAAREGPSTSLRLTIELVPSSCQRSNARDLYPEEWKNVVLPAVRQAATPRGADKPRCEICGGRDFNGVVGHEVWEYDDEHAIQRLARVQALCSNCHDVKHILNTKSRGGRYYEEALIRLQRFNGMNRPQAEQYIEESLTVCRERGKHAWRIDLTELTQYGVDVAAGHLDVTSDDEDEDDRAERPQAVPPPPQLSESDRDRSATHGRGPDNPEPFDAPHPAASDPPTPPRLIEVDELVPPPPEPDDDE